MTPIKSCAVAGDEFFESVKLQLDKLRVASSFS
jgi:hypothetical protein